MTWGWSAIWQAACSPRAHASDVSKRILEDKARILPADSFHLGSGFKGCRTGQALHVDVVMGCPGPSELLIADVDNRTTELCAPIAQECQLAVRRADDTEMLLDMLESGLADVLVISEEFAGGHEMEFLRHLHYWYPETQVIVAAESPSYPAAVRAAKMGAFDYVPKPLEREALRHTIERALEEYLAETGKHLAVRSSGDHGVDLGIVGQSDGMQNLRRIIGKVSANVYPVLLLGESGTGKELVARAIHFSGPRREHPFIPVDCGALVPTLMESELFGHERGSFTGADRAKDGLLKIAEGGTVFFDEVGELTRELQGRLLCAVQEKEIRPVGSTKRIRIDVRVIAATNRKLEDEVRTGRFRKDLYFRLNVVTLKLPPLRERLEDIEELVETFLLRIAETSNQPKRQVSREVLRMLKTYSWPGNIRELENSIERAAVLSTNPMLEPIDFPTHISSRLKVPHVLGDLEPQRQKARVVPLDEVERHAILNAVAEAKGDKLLAARMLRMGKTTLYRKLKEYKRRFQADAADEPNSL